MNTSSCKAFHFFTKIRVKDKLNFIKVFLCLFQSFQSAIKIDDNVKNYCGSPSAHLRDYMTQKIESVKIRCNPSVFFISYHTYYLIKLLLNTALVV